MNKIARRGAGSGLTEEDTEDAPVFPYVWEKIAPKIEGLPLVAHNSRFDKGCLKAVFRVYQMDYPEYEFHDTLSASRNHFGCRLPDHQLQTVAAACGYDLTNHHHALAGAGVVSLDDVSVLDNAALSPFSQNRFSAGFSCQSWMSNVLGGGMSSYSMSARYSFSKAGTVYLGMRSLKTPPFEQTDDYGNVIDDSSSPLDMAFEAGYAYRFFGDFSAALTARYLRLDPGYGNAANAVSFDAGLAWRHIFKGVMEDIAAIAQLKNFGTSPDYGSGRRSLPWLVNAGASAGLLAGKHNRFRAGAALDISVAPTCGSLSPSRGVSASFGAEYSYRRMVYARGGYHLGDKSAGEQRWASVGLGFRFWHMTLDAALILTPSSSPLHDTASGTLSIWF